MSREDFFIATETVFIEILCFLLGIHVKSEACKYRESVLLKQATQK